MALPLFRQGTVVKFGTLWLNGVKQALPTNPILGGDIPAYSSGNIEFMDTDSDDAYKLRWVPVSIGGKWFLVCDRNIVRSVSWNTLGSQGYASGVNTVIDGVSVKLRLMSGGERPRDSGDDNSGGTPTDNEWDTIIQNEGGYSGLPTPVAADKISPPNTDGANNQLWHWANMYSWAKELHGQLGAGRVIRGRYCVSHIFLTSPNPVYESIGFRPILEVLGLAPIISDLGGSLGNKNVSFSISYSVSSPELETFSLVEQLDGLIIRSLTNQSAGNFTLDLSSLWTSVPVGNHTLTVTATYPNGAVGSNAATFKKVNSGTSTPIMPIVNGARIPVSGYFEFTPRADPDGDTMTATLVHADNSDFTSATNVTDGLQKWSGLGWGNVENIPPSAAGVAHRLPYSGLTLNTTSYFRVRINDITASGSSATIGSTRALKVGTTLWVQTPVYTAAAMPTTVKVVLDAVLSSGAGVTQILVCNNANDASPTWEDATSAYNAGGSAVYTFTNASKTAGSWGCAARVTIGAGTATGEISLAKVSLGVLM